MTTRANEVPTSVNHTLIAAALTALRDLLLGGHVRITEHFDSGPVVEVSIINRPVQRDVLINGLSELQGPTDWSGNHYGYRDWRGLLLTMPVLISERIDRTIPDAIRAASAEPEPAAVPGWPDNNCPRTGCEQFHSGVPHVHDATAAAEPETEPRRCWTCSQAPSCEPEHAIYPCMCDCHTDPSSAVRQYISDADPRPLLKLAMDERFGEDRPRAAETELAVGGYPTPVAGVTVVPGRPVTDEEGLQKAWSKYARARAMCYFGEKRYPTIADARDAVKYWPGWDMLTAADVEIVAGMLVDPPRVPEPEPEPTRGLRRLLAVVRTGDVR